MNSPAPLAWLQEFIASTSRALGQGIVYELKPHVNPLVYILKLKWTEPINGKLKSNMWNLFEIWAHKNDAVPEGKVDVDDCSMNIVVGVKRRFGDPKHEQP